jgi:hypothetical protein
MCTITEDYALEPCNWAQYRFEELTSTEASTWLQVRFAMDGFPYSNHSVYLEISHSETADAWPEVGQYDWRLEADPSTTGVVAEWEWTLHCGWRDGFYTVTVISSSDFYANPVTYRLEVCMDSVSVPTLPAFVPTPRCEDVWATETAEPQLIDSFRDGWQYDVAERTSAHLSFEVPDWSTLDPVDSQGRRIGLAPGMRVRVENLVDRELADDDVPWFVTLRYAQFTDAWYYRNGYSDACPSDYSAVTQHHIAPDRRYEPSATTPPTSTTTTTTPAPPTTTTPIGGDLPTAPPREAVPDYCALNEEMAPEGVWDLPTLNVSSPYQLSSAWYGFHVSRVGQVTLELTSGTDEGDYFAYVYRCTAQEGCGPDAAMGGCLEPIMWLGSHTAGGVKSPTLLRGDYYVHVTLWNGTQWATDGQLHMTRTDPETTGVEMRPLTCGLCPQAVNYLGLNPRIRNDHVDIYVPRCSAHAGMWYLSVQPPHSYDCREPFNYTFTVRIEIDQLNPRQVLTWDGSSDIEVSDGRIEGFAMPMGTVHDFASVPLQNGAASAFSVLFQGPAMQGAMYPLSYPLAPQSLWDRPDHDGPIDRYERAAAWYQVELPGVSALASPTLEVSLRGAQWGRRTDTGVWSRLPLTGINTRNVYDAHEGGPTSWAQFGRTDSPQLLTDPADMEFWGATLAPYRQVSLLLHQTELPIGSLDYASTNHHDTQPHSCAHASQSCVANPDRLHHEHDGSTSSCAVVLDSCAFAPWLGGGEHFFVGVAPTHAIWARLDGDGVVTVGPERTPDPHNLGWEPLAGQQGGFTGSTYFSNSESPSNSFVNDFHGQFKKRSLVDQAYNGDPTSPSQHNVELQYTLQDLDLRFALRVRVAEAESAELASFPPAGEDEPSQVADPDNAVRGGEYSRFSVAVTEADIDNRLEIEVFVPYGGRDVSMYVWREDADSTASPLAGDPSKPCFVAEWQCATNVHGSPTSGTRSGSCTYVSEGCALQTGTYHVAVYGEPTSAESIGVDDETVSFTAVARWHEAVALDQWEVPHNQLVWPSSYNHYALWLPEANQTVALRVRVGDVENGVVHAYMQYEEPAGEANCFSFGWQCQPAGGAGYCDLVAPYCQQRAGAYYVSVRGVESTWSAGTESRGAPSSGRIGYTITAYRHVAEWVDWMPSMDVNDADSAVRVVRSIPATLDATGVVKFADDIVRPDVRYPFWDPRNGEFRPFGQRSFGQGSLAILGSEAHYYYFEYSADRSSFADGVSSLHIRLGAVPHVIDAAAATSDRLTLFVAPETIANEMCSCWSCTAEAGAHGSYCKLALPECDLLPVLDEQTMTRSTYSGAETELWYVTVRYDQYDTHASEPVDYVLDLEMVGVADVALESGAAQYGQLGSHESQHYYYDYAPTSSGEDAATTALNVEMYINRDHLDSVEFYMAVGSRAGSACPEWAAIAPVCEGASYEEGQGASQYEVCSFKIHPCDFDGSLRHWFSVSVADQLFADAKVEYSIKVWSEPIAALEADGWPVTGAVWQVNHYRLDVSAADVRNAAAPKHLFVQLDAVRDGSVQSWITRGALGGACSADSSSCPADRRPWRNEFEVEIDNCQLAADDVYYVSVAVLEQDDALQPVRYTLRAYTQTMRVQALPDTAYSRVEAQAARLSLDRLEQVVLPIEISDRLSALTDAQRAGASLHVRVWNVTWGTMMYWLNSKDGSVPAGETGELPQGIASPACHQQRGSVTGNTLIEEPYSRRAFSITSGQTEAGAPADEQQFVTDDLDRTNTFREVPPTETYIRVHCDVRNVHTYYLTLYASLVPEWERLPCDRRINASINVWLEYPKEIVPTTTFNFTDSSTLVHWTRPDRPLTIWNAQHWQTAADPNDLLYSPQGTGDFVWSRTYSDEWKYFSLRVDLTAPSQVDFYVASLNLTGNAVSNGYSTSDHSLWQGFGYPFLEQGNGAFDAYYNFVSDSDLFTAQGALPGIASPVCGASSPMDAANCGTPDDQTMCYRGRLSPCDVPAGKLATGYAFIATRYRAAGRMVDNEVPSFVVPAVMAQVWPWDAGTEGFVGPVMANEEFALNDMVAAQLYNDTSDIDATRIGTSVQYVFDEGNELGYRPHSVDYSSVRHVRVELPESIDVEAPFWTWSLTVALEADTTGTDHDVTFVSYVTVGDEAPTINVGGFRQDGSDIEISLSTSDDCARTCGSRTVSSNSTFNATICNAGPGSSSSACCSSESLSASRIVWVSVASYPRVDADFGDDARALPASGNFSISVQIMPRQVVYQEQGDVDEMLTVLTAPYGNRSLTTRAQPDMGYLDVYAFDIDMSPHQVMWIELRATEPGSAPLRVDLQYGSIGFGGSDGFQSNLFAECGDGSRWTCRVNGTFGLTNEFEDANRCYVQLTACEVASGRWYLTVRRETGVLLSEQTSYTLDWVVVDAPELTTNDVRYTVPASETDDIYQHVFLPWSNWNHSSEAETPVPTHSRYEADDRTEIVIEVSEVFYRDNSSSLAPQRTVNCSEVELYVNARGFAGENFSPDLGTLALNDDTEENCLGNEPSLCTWSDPAEGCPRRCTIRACDLDSANLLVGGVWVSVRSTINETVSFNISYSVRNDFVLPPFTIELEDHVPVYPFNNRTEVERIDANTTVITEGPGITDRYTMWFEVGTQALAGAHPLSSLWVRLDGVHPEQGNATELRVWPQRLCEDQTVPTRRCNAAPHLEEDTFHAFPVNSTERTVGYTPRACVVQYDPCEFDLATQRTFYLSVTFENASLIYDVTKTRANFTVEAQIREPEKVEVNIDMTAPSASWSLVDEQFIEERWHFYHFDFGDIVSPQHHGGLTVRLDAECSRDDHSVDFVVNTRYTGWREHFATNECNEYEHTMGGAFSTHTYSWTFCEWQAGDVYVGVHSNFNSLMHPNFTVPIRYSLYLDTHPEPSTSSLVPNVWHSLSRVDIGCARDRAQVRIDWSGQEWGAQVRVQLRNRNGAHGARHVCTRWHYTSTRSWTEQTQVIEADEHIFGGSPLPVTGGVGCDDYSTCVALSHGAQDGDALTYSAELLEPCDRRNAWQYLIFDGLADGDEVRIVYEPKHIPTVSLDSTVGRLSWPGQVALNQWAFYKLDIDLADRDAAPALWQLSFGLTSVEGGDYVEMTMLRGDAERPQVPSLGCIDRSLACATGDDSCTLVETLADSWRDNADAYWVGVVARGASGANCLTRFDMWATVVADDVAEVRSCEAECVSVTDVAQARYVLRAAEGETWTENLVLFDVRELSGDAPVRISVQQGRVASAEDNLVSYVIDASDLSGTIDPKDLDALWTQFGDLDLADQARLFATVGEDDFGFANEFGESDFQFRPPASNNRKRDAVPDASQSLKFKELRDRAEAYDAASFSPFRWALPCLGDGDIFVTVESAAAASLVLEFRVENAAPAHTFAELSESTVTTDYYTWTPTALPTPWSVLDDLADCERQLAPFGWTHLYKWTYTQANADAKQPFGWELEVDTTSLFTAHATAAEYASEASGEDGEGINGLFSNNVLYPNGNQDRAGVLLYVNEDALPAPWLAASTSQYPGVPGLNPLLAQSGDHASCSSFPPGADLGAKKPAWQWSHREECHLDARDLYFYVVFPVRQVGYEEVSCASGNLAAQLACLLFDQGPLGAWVSTPFMQTIFDQLGSEYGGAPWASNDEFDQASETPVKKRGAPSGDSTQWVPNEPSVIAPNLAKTLNGQFNPLPWADLARNSFVWPYTLRVWVEDGPTVVAVGSPLNVTDAGCTEVYEFTATEDNDNQLIIRVGDLDGVLDGQTATVSYWREGESAHCARYDVATFNNEFGLNAERNCYFARLSDTAAGERYFVRVEIDDCVNDCGTSYSYTVDVHYAAEYALDWLVPVAWPIPAASPTVGQWSMGTDPSQFVWFKGSVVEGHVYELDLAAAASDVAFISVRLWNVAGGDATLALLSRNLYSVIDLCGADFGAVPKETLSHGNTGSCAITIDSAKLAALGNPDRLLIGVVGKGRFGELDGWPRVEYDLDVTWNWQALGSGSSNTNAQLSGVDRDFYVTNSNGQSVVWTVTVHSGPAVRIRIRDAPSESEARWSYKEQWCSYGECTIEVATRAQHPATSQNFYIELDRGSEQRFEKDTLYSIAASVGSQNTAGTLVSVTSGLEFCGILGEFEADQVQDSQSSVWTADFAARDQEAAALIDGIVSGDFFQPPPSPECLDALAIWACVSTFLETDGDGFVLAPCRSHCETVVEECGDWVYAAGLPEFDCENSRYVDGVDSPCSGRRVIEPPPVPTVIPSPIPNASNLTEPIIELTTTTGTTTTTTSTTSSTSSTGTDGPVGPPASASSVTVSLALLFISAIMLILQ